MASVPQKTLNWLYDVLKREYHDPNRTYSDVAQTLTQHQSLAPRTDVYTSENGVPALLLNLKGTLPVNFRGTLYRFPIAVWIPHAYPYEAPIAYVMPTDDMMVRPGQHVSASDGKIYHHYLARWKDTWDRSTIVEFLTILADVFSKEPPVMAKAQQMPPHQQPQHRQSGPPPVPPTPQDPRRYSSQPPLPPHPSRTASPGGPPPPPPKPGADISGRGYTGPPAPAPKPGRYEAPPPLPPQTHSGRPSQQPMGNGSAHHPASSVQYLPQRTSSLRQDYAPSQQSSNTQQYQPQSPDRQFPNQQASPQISMSNQQYISSPPPPSQQQNYHQGYQQQIFDRVPQQQSQSHQIPQSVQQRQQQPPPNWQPPPQQGQFHPHQNQPAPPHPQPQKPAAPADLLSEDDSFQVSLTAKSNLAPPPIPTNPEKTALLSHLSHQLLQHLHTTISQTQTSALPSLQSQHNALNSASQTLTSELHQLQSLSSQLQSNISALQNTITSANDTIRSTQDKKHPSHPDNIPAIDQIIIPPTVVARQLYDAVAEQRGYEAAIFALNEAFVRGRIGADLWGRKMRECAREEMRRKWLVRKIGEGLGLEEH